MAVFLWSRPTKEYLDVYMSPLNYLNIKDWVEHQLIPNIVAYPGVLDTRRLVCSTTSLMLCIELLIQDMHNLIRLGSHLRTQTYIDSMGT